MQVASPLPSHCGSSRPLLPAPCNCLSKSVAPLHCQLHCLLPSLSVSPASVLQEVEAQYKEGTVNHALVAVLKAVQPDALTAQGGWRRRQAACL